MFYLLLTEFSGNFVNEKLAKLESNCRSSRDDSFCIVIWSPANQLAAPSQYKSGKKYVSDNESIFQ